MWDCLLHVDSTLLQYDAVPHHHTTVLMVSVIRVLFFFSVQVYDRLLITSWGHDPGVVPTSNVLTMLNDALTHSAVLIQVNTHTHKPQFYNEVSEMSFHCLLLNHWILHLVILCVSTLVLSAITCGYVNCTECLCLCKLQGHGMHGHGETVHIPFPFDEEDLKAGEIIIDKIMKSLGSLTSYTLLYAYTLDQLLLCLMRKRQSWLS